jgi:hypothetical protein
VLGVLSVMSGASNTAGASLSRAAWLQLRSEHHAKVASWADDRVYRANLAIPDVVYDFLFTYYSFRPAYLKRWTPGADVPLADACPEELDWAEDFVEGPHGWVIPASTFPSRRREYLSWAIAYLERTAERPASFHCFGLHEWAMVYKSDAPRHSHVPLRLSEAEIATVVEDSELRCTHYDAFRFFTPQAVPLNRHPLVRTTTTDFDQRGCIHVTMDLYRFAHKIAPWCPSELIADTFLMACEARAIDMRASPYDLSSLDMKPICIETAEGRAEYIAEQRELTGKAAPLRYRLLDVYRYLRERA